MLLRYVKEYIGIPLGLTSYDNELETIIMDSLKEIDSTYTEETIYANMNDVDRYNVLSYIQNRVMWILLEREGVPVESFYDAAMQLQDYFYKIKESVTIPNYTNGPIVLPEYIQEVINKYSNVTEETENV